MFRNIVILFLLCLSLGAEAQIFTVKSFDYSNGLLSGSNYCTMQDSSGYYWTSSYGGLVRFDGTTFQPFTNHDGLMHYKVNSLYEEKKGSYIVCNEFSLLRFDGTHVEEIKTSSTEKYKYQKIIPLRNGQILCQTHLGIVQWLPNNQLIPLRNKEHKILLVCETEKGKFSLQDNQEITLTQDQQVHTIGKLPPTLQVKELQCFQNELYLVTTKGVYTIHAKEAIPFRIAQKKVVSVFADKSNQLWFTDEHHQLWLQTPTSLINLSNQYHIRPIIDPQYFADKNNHVVITSLYGLTLFKESRCVERPIEEINNTTSYFVLSEWNADTLCAGIQQDGIVAIHQQKKIRIPFSSTGIPFQGKTLRCEVSSMGSPDHHIVRIQNLGLFTLQKNKLQPYCSIPFDSESLLKGFYDKDESCYYAGGTNGKLYKFSPHHIDSFSTPATAGLIMNSPCKLATGQILFLGTHEKLFMLQDRAIVDLTAQLHTTNKTFSIYLNKNKLWVVVHGIEIQEYEINQARLQYKRSITKDDGLADANIASLIFDSEENIWLNTFSGVYFLKKPIQKEVYCKKINLQQGSSSAPMISSIAFADHKLYALCLGSWVEVNAKEVLKETPPHGIYFSSIKINNQNLPIWLANKTISYSNQVFTLPTYANSILFQCNAIYFGFDDAIQFLYKLNNEPWVHLNGANSIQYNDLNSGQYTLQVKAVNKLNPASCTETQFSFYIQPPYWKTWWFKCLLGLATFACIYLLIKRRDAIKEKENKIALQMSELKLTALQSQMNPHFIFNSMNSIQNYIMQQKPLDAARYLSKFSLLMRRILDQSFHNTSPLSEIIETLRMYLELEAYRFNHGFTWNITVADQVQTSQIKIPSMLLQPFVENAIIHGLMPKAGEKKLEIIFQQKEQALYILIDDNGVGVKDKTDSNKNHISRAQKLIYEMMDSMKEIMHMEPIIETTHKKNEDGSPRGTTITIILPLKSIRA